MLETWDRDFDIRLLDAVVSGSLANNTGNGEIRKVDAKLICKAKRNIARPVMKLAIIELPANADGE